jgi:hypothetical protein
MAVLDFPAAPTVGQVATLTNGFSYQWDGAVWTLTPASPGQAAGGDLTGTYPNPTIRAGAVTGAQVADATLPFAKLSERAYARVNRSTVLALTTGTSVNISFDTVETNVDGLFSLASPTRLTAVNAGFYLVGGNVEFDLAANGFRRLQIVGSVFMGSIDAPGGEWATSTWGAGARRLLIVGARFFAAGEWAELQVAQNSGATINLTAGSVRPTMWMLRVA